MVKMAIFTCIILKNYCGSRVPGVGGCEKKGWLQLPNTFSNWHSIRDQMAASPSSGKATHYSGRLHGEVILGPFWHIPGDSQRSGHRCYWKILCLVTVMGYKNERGFHGRWAPYPSRCFTVIAGSTGWTVGLQTGMGVVPRRMRGQWSREAHSGALLWGPRRNL